MLSKKAIIKKIFALIFFIISPAIFAEQISTSSNTQTTSNTEQNITVQSSAQESLDAFPEEPANKPVLERVSSPQVKSYLDSLSSTQEYVGDYVQSTGEAIDRFFGSDDLDIISSKNRLTIYTPVTFYEGGRNVSEMNFKLQIDLPKTNYRWKLFLSSFEEQEEDETLTNLDQANNNPGINEDSENRLGGRYLINDSTNRITQTDLGMKFINFIEPNPYAEFKDRFKYDLNHGIQSRTTNKVLLERDEGFAWEGEQVFDKRISKDGLARSQTRLNWWHRDELARFKQRFVYFHKFSPFRANAYYIDSNWRADEEEFRFDYVALGMNWRERLYHDWLFAEVEPRVTWSQFDSQLSSPQYSVRFMLEMRFYR